MQGAVLGISEVMGNSAEGVEGQVINNCFLAQKRRLSLPAKHIKLVIFKVLVLGSVTVGLNSSLRCCRPEFSSAGCNGVCQAGGPCAMAAALLPIGGALVTWGLFRLQARFGYCRHSFKAEKIHKPGKIGQFSSQTGLVV